MTTILLVEDAYDLAQVIIRELEASGYSVLHASDGLTALQLHAKEQPALVKLAMYHLPYLSHFAIPVFLLLNFIALIGWCVAIVQASRGKYYRLPFIGDLVAASINRGTPVK